MLEPEAFAVIDKIVDQTLQSKNGVGSNLFIIIMLLILIFLKFSKPSKPIVEKSE